MELIFLEQCTTLYPKNADIGCPTWFLLLGPILVVATTIIKEVNTFSNFVNIIFIG